MVDDLHRKIASGTIDPLYVLCGEAYPRDQLAAAIKQAVVGDQASAFNMDTFAGKETTAASILSAARTMPMFGDKRLVVVSDVHAMAADQLSGLLDYLADPSPYCCLLMIGEKVDLRLKFFAAARKRGALQRFEPLKDRQVPRWVADEAGRQRIALKPGAAEAIADAVGADMAQLASALEQLSLFAGGQPVTVADVEQLLAKTRQRSIFELTNAVGRRDRRQAMLILRRMTDSRESGIRIVAMLARHVRQLWQAKELVAAQTGEKEIAQAIGVHPFFVRDIVGQARDFDVQTLARTHRALFDADRTLKSSKLSDELVLDRLVLALCA
ncbi:MAG: DNA polymerase III subunit delta [Deltaproteobacteria bacterium]|nr:DNA polymerase III subunit delta [Deltaproteobacteria bacterium]